MERQRRLLLSAFRRRPRVPFAATVPTRLRGRMSKNSRPTRRPMSMKKSEGRHRWDCADADASATRGDAAPNPVSPPAAAIGPPHAASGRAVAHRTRRRREPRVGGDGDRPPFERRLRGDRSLESLSFEVDTDAGREQRGALLKIAGPRIRSRGRNGRASRPLSLLAEK